METKSYIIMGGVVLMLLVGVCSAAVTSINYLFLELSAIVPTNIQLPAELVDDGEASVLPVASDLFFCPPNGKSTIEKCICTNGAKVQESCTTHEGPNTCFYSCP